jgi:hypothetical protein
MINAAIFSDKLRVWTNYMLARIRVAPVHHITNNFGAKKFRTNDTMLSTVGKSDYCDDDEK